MAPWLSLGESSDVIEIVLKHNNNRALVLGFIHNHRVHGLIWFNMVSYGSMGSMLGSMGDFPYGFNGKMGRLTQDLPTTLQDS